MAPRNCHHDDNSTAADCCGRSEDRTTPKTLLMDIEDLHLAAIAKDERTYIDPATEFMVFTEAAHLRRGVCCGNQCRHCPYGWANVRSGARRAGVVQSGNRAAAKQRLEELKEHAVERTMKRKEEKEEPHEVTVQPTNVPIVHVRKESIEREPLHSPTTQSVSNNNKSGGRHGGRHTNKNVPYTRYGDKGSSQLLTGERRSKDDVAFEAMGTVDELCTVVGVAHAELTANYDDDKNTTTTGELASHLVDVMSRLFDLGSHVAKPRRLYDDNDDDDISSFPADGIGGGFDEAHVQDLEDWIDTYTEALPELTSFILPTGAKAAAQLHVARTVCRRAERTVVPLVRGNVCDPNALQYLNRLSDFFFTAARYVNQCEKRQECLYRRSHRGATQRTVVVVSQGEGE